MSKTRKAKPIWLRMTIGEWIAAEKYAMKPHPYLLGKADLAAAFLAGVRWQRRRKEPKA